MVLMFRFLFTLPLLLCIAACSDDPPPAPPNDVTDTTSHDFLWTTYYLGDAQSHLQDVFAINDSDVWAVGEIYLRDSTGQLDLNMYNAAHWDGSSWTLQRLAAVTWFGDTTTNTKVTSVYAVNQNDVWMFTNAGAVIRLYDNHWDTRFIGERRGTITKIWGNSSDNLFFVGTNGSITHWDGVKFTRMESGTTTDLYDISGTFNGKVYACGGEFSGTVLEYDGNSWKRVDSLSDTKVGRASVFSNREFFAVGGGNLRYIDKKRGDTCQSPPKEIMEGGFQNGIPIYIEGIRGSSRTNVFAIGGWQYVLHYNGKSWKWYEELWDTSGHPQYSVSVTEDGVFIVGSKDGKATILHGRRSK